MLFLAVPICLNQKQLEEGKVEGGGILSRGEAEQLPGNMIL